MLQLHSQFEIDKLIKYSDTIEELLHNQIDRIDRKSIENAKNFLLGSSETFDTKLLNEESWNYIEFQSFKQILRASLFTFSFSFLENQLTNTCYSFQKTRQIPISVSDLRGDLLERVKVYQRDLAKLPFLENSKIWKDIISIRDIRNFVVHNNRNIPLNHKNRKSVIAFLNKSNLGSLDEGEFIVFSEKFNFGVLRIIQTFFESYYKEMGI